MLDYLIVFGAGVVAVKYGRRIAKRLLSFRQISETTQAIIDRLNDNNVVWKLSGCMLRCGDAAVWIANEAYGLHVKIGGETLVSLTKAEKNAIWYRGAKSRLQQIEKAKLAEAFRK